MTLLDNIRKGEKASRWIGVLLVIAGTLSIAAPFGAGLYLTVMVGALLLIGGVAKLFLVFKSGGLGPGILLALLAALNVVAGGYMISQPVEALATLTLLLAAYFVASGVVQIAAAVGARPAPGWGWLLSGSILSLLLGLMIWQQLPLSGVWAVGTLVGIQLLMSGWVLIAVASTRNP